MWQAIAFRPSSLIAGASQPPCTTRLSDWVPQGTNRTQAFTGHYLENIGILPKSYCMAVKSATMQPVKRVAASCLLGWSKPMTLSVVMRAFVSVEKWHRKLRSKCREVVRPAMRSHWCRVDNCRIRGISARRTMTSRRSTAEQSLHRAPPTWTSATTWNGCRHAPTVIDATDRPPCSEIHGLN